MGAFGRAHAGAGRLWRRGVFAAALGHADAARRALRWAEAEIVDQLNLTPADRDGAYTYELSDGGRCEITPVLTSTMIVHLFQHCGDLFATNPAGSAGCVWPAAPGAVQAPATIPGPSRALEGGAACLPELRTALEALRPASRDAAARQADLDALDAALVEAAEALNRTFTSVSRTERTAEARAERPMAQLPLPAPGWPGMWRSVALVRGLRALPAS